MLKNIHIDTEQKENESKIENIYLQSERDN